MQLSQVVVIHTICCNLAYPIPVILNNKPYSRHCETLDSAIFILVNVAMTKFQKFIEKQEQ